ncbi:Cullin-3, partial [Physocladia obscura]
MHARVNENADVKILTQQTFTINQTQTDDAWETLKTAIEEIQDKNSSALSFEVLYRNAYNMVLNKQGDKLYAGVGSVITNHLRRVAAEVVAPAFATSANTHQSFTFAPAAITTTNTTATNASSSLPSSIQNNTTNPFIVEAGLAGRVSLASPHAFVRTLKAVWDDHTTCMVMIRDILLYMDRVYVRSVNKSLVYDYGLDLFRDVVLHSENFPIRDRTIETLLHLILLERQGDVIDRFSIKSIIDMFLSLNSTDARATSETTQSTITTYEHDFEKYFLATSRQFYVLEAAALLQSCDAKTFLIKIESRLNEEDARVSAYLSIDTGPKLSKILENVLIESNVAAVIEMENSGLVVMLTNNNVEDLARMYRLFERVPNGHTSMRESISHEIQRLGKSINELHGGIPASDGLLQKSSSLLNISAGSSTTGENAATAISVTTANPIKWVEALLEVKERFDKLIETAFAKNKSFINMINDAMGIVINANRSACEFLSLFIDDNLKKGSKGKYETDVDVVLDNTVALFRLLNQKDVFERYYKQHLAKRLLYGRSVSEDAEKGFIAKLKVECGSQFTQKLEGMFNDMKLSEDTMTQFRNLPVSSTSDGPSIDLNVKILTITLWPTFPSTNVNYPQSLINCLSRFERYYLSTRHTGRKLTWLHSMGNADLRANFPKGKKEINMSVYAMIVLYACFNDGEASEIGIPVKYTQISETTGISGPELKRTLQSLSLGKHKILIKSSSKKKDVSEMDEFSLNLDFSSPLSKIKILTISAGSGYSGAGLASTTGNSLETEQERGETLEKIDEARKHQVEAAIVRTMKSRKRLDHNTLVLEVTNQLQSRFMPAPAMIKTRIEGLIEREYLERDPKDRK